MCGRDGEAPSARELRRRLDVVNWVTTLMRQHVPSAWRVTRPFGRLCSGHHSAAGRRQPGSHPSQCVDR